MVPYGDCPLDGERVGEMVYMDMLTRCRRVEQTKESIWQGKKLLHLAGILLKFIAPLV